MIIHFFDIEATGVDPESAVPLEYAYMNYEIETGRVVKAGSFLIDAGHEIPETVYRLTGIQEDMLLKHAKPASEAIFEAVDLWAKADYLGAHYGLMYDVPVMKRFAEKHGDELPDKILIDTTMDLPIPDEAGQRNLAYLCGFYGIVNPCPHQAFGDVLATVQLFQKFEGRIGDILDSAESPMILIEAKVEYEDRQLAKDAGFYWDKPGKAWLKRIKEIHYKNAEFSFDTGVVK